MTVLLNDDHKCASYFLLLRFSTKGIEDLHRSDVIFVN